MGQNFLYLLFQEFMNKNKTLNLAILENKIP